MIVVSAIAAPRSSSTRTGIFAIGQIALNAATDCGLPKSTMTGSKAISFFMSAISTLWQNDASG